MSYQRTLKISTVDLTFAIWAIAVPVVFGSSLVNTDGDMARHLVVGEHLLRNGWIVNDVFSLTRSGEPFLAHAWLSQVLYASFHELGGIAGVAIGAGLIIAAAYALVVLFLRRRGVDPCLAYLIGMAAAVIGAPHWVARPHLFTLIGAALLLFLVEGPIGRRRLWWFAPLFLVWTNLHAGFIIGFAILTAYLGGDLLEAWTAADRTERREWLARAKYHAAGLGIAVAASMVNPHGILLHFDIQSSFINPYLGGEWLSPNFHRLQGQLFLFVIAGVVALLALGRRRLPMPRLFLLLLMLGSALFAQRNISLFGLLVFPVLALEYDSEWRHLNVRGLNRARRVLREAEAVAAPGRWFGVFAALLLLLALNGGRIAGVQAVTDRFDEDVFPVEAVSWAKQTGLDGHVYHDFIWGGYILYAWPGQKVFIDWATDFLGDDLAKDYLTIRNVRPGWDNKLRDYDIAFALIPTESALAYALEREGWRKLYVDHTAVILARDPDAPPSLHDHDGGV